MGCKAPKPQGGKVGGFAAKGTGKGVLNVIGAFAAKGAGKGVLKGGKNGPPAESGSWQCSCGFNNKPTNDVCGGNGPMGCKKPRPQQRVFKKPMNLAPMAKRPLNVAPMAMKVNKGAGKSVALPAGGWKSGACGFTNKPGNEVCGGDGHLGCKAPKPYQGMVRKPMFVKEPLMGGGKRIAGKGAGKAAKGGKGDGKGWTCVCGFANKDSNEVCGGKGPMGCKKPRFWECVCGFKNKQSNEVCGGSGPMGCKEPRPDLDVLEVLEEA